jgi:hypothetical protein
MSVVRSGMVVPGLARLLGHAPREGLGRLAVAWGLPDTAGIAAIYRQMTDGARLLGRIEQLGERERLVFERLLAAPTPLGADALLRQLPFSEEGLERALGGLAAIGLAWRYVAPGEGRVAEGQRWLTPRDLATAVTAERRRMAGKLAAIQPAEPGSPPELTPTAAPPIVRPAGEVPRLIDRLRTPSDHLAAVAPAAAEVLRYARRAGLALGVHQVTGRRLAEGPRAAAWAALDSAGRVRALARWWLVDESLGTVRSAIRHALWSTLRTAKPDTWYDFNWLARRIAWEAATVVPEQVGGTGRGGTGAGAGVTRRDLERGLAALSSLGVVLRGTDPRGRLVAVEVTPEGQRALE